MRSSGGVRNPRANAVEVAILYCCDGDLPHLAHLSISFVANALGGYCDCLRYRRENSGHP